MPLLPVVCFAANRLFLWLPNSVSNAAPRNILPQDAVYPTSEVDGDGKPYSGANKYVMHFPKGQTPPADGFWSITMYNADYFFVDDKLNKYMVSPGNDLKYNDDGSLDLYIQNESPGKDKEANWLPAPKDKFILMMRLYWPKEKDPS